MTLQLNLDELHLVSVALCPYVQRAMILLREKNASFRISYIDLAKKPSWFLSMSPRGQVPVLDVGGTALFESTAICEYIDETQGEPLHSRDPLVKAIHRAWMEYSSVLLILIEGMVVATKVAELAPKRSRLHQLLGEIENHVKMPFFDGRLFTMVDVFMAPVFRYLQAFENWGDLSYLTDFPKLEVWSTQIMRRPSVLKAVPDDYRIKLADYLRSKNSLYLTQLKIP